jgi:hypothetical protein
MNIILPFYFVSFETEEVIDLEDEIKICRLNEDIRQKLKDILPNDTFHLKNFHERLKKEFLSFYLLINSEETETRKNVLKVHEFLRIMRIVYHNPASIILIYFMDEKGEIKGYEEYPIDVFTHFGPVVNFTADDIKKLKAIWSNYKDIVMPAGHKNRLWYAIFLHELANQSYYYEFRILNDTMALECLFSTTTQEIAFQISYRISWFLFQKLDPVLGLAREDVFNKFKKFYTLRSKIVHGVMVDEDEIKEYSGKLNNYVHWILNKILSNKNLINTFMSDETTLNDYLLSLCIGKGENNKSTQ